MINSIRQGYTNIIYKFILLKITGSIRNISNSVSYVENFILLFAVPVIIFFAILVFKNIWGKFMEIPKMNEYWNLLWNLLLLSIIILNYGILCIKRVEKQDLNINGVYFEEDCFQPYPNNLIINIFNN